MFFSLFSEIYVREVIYNLGREGGDTDLTYSFCWTYLWEVIKKVIVYVCWLEVIRDPFGVPQYSTIKMIEFSGQ